MQRFLLNWLVTALGVLAASEIVPGITHDSWTSLAVAALVLGVLNAVVKPILTLLSLPLVLLTLGLFLVVINAILLMLAGRLVDGFDVDGFWPAAGGALVISVVGMLVRPPPPRRQAKHPVRRPGDGVVIDV